MKNPRKKALAILAGLAVTGIVGASAASLGTVTNESLGAATEVVASCDDAVTVDYATSYDATAGIVEVDTVTIDDVNDACEGLDWEVILTGASGVLGGDSDTGLVLNGTGADDNSFTATMPAGVDAELVTGIVITISG